MKNKEQDNLENQKKCCQNKCHCKDHDLKQKIEEQCKENCQCEKSQNVQNDQNLNLNQDAQENDYKEYLELAKRIQAEFENFRKRTYFDLQKAKEDGEISVIEAFLPCLDTFKVAKKSITDQAVLEGIEMIENNIIQTLNKLGVEKIDCVGKPYDHNLHNVIAVMKVEDKDNDIILDEYQAGYKFKDKVIRYSKVIVNKKED